MKARLSWEGSDLTSVVAVDSIEEGYGLCGEFWFEQGGHGDMGFPSSVEPTEESKAAAILGRKGRKVNSPAQQEAARANGKNGGRPRKEKANA